MLHNDETAPEDASRTDIEQQQWRRLKRLLREIDGRNPFWTRRLREHRVCADDLNSRDDLQRLPLTTKQDLVEDQDRHPPYGSNLTYPLDRYVRLHQTSGTSTGRPLRWLDTAASWRWFLETWEQIYRIAGVRSEDVFCFPFSFGPFIGFWAAFEGAFRLGHRCLTAGGMSSTSRLRFIEDHRATVVACTPTYALRLAEVADQEGIPLADGPVRMLIVAGEPGGCVPAVRERIEAAWGARVIDHWGMTEIGPLAVECAERPGGMHVLETECIVEIRDPETGEPAASGAMGELIVTNLGRVGSPLIRYRTGDLVRVDEQPCPCGRSLIRLDGGILGRSDDMFIVRGNNVLPSTIEAILREFSEVAEYRLIVSTSRSMNQLRIEVEPVPELAADAAERLRNTVARSIRDRLLFEADVQLVPTGSLPRFELKGRRFIRE